MKFYRPLGDRECTGDFFVCQTAHHLTVIGCWRNLSAQFDRDSTQRGRPVVSTKNRALIDECRVPQISTAVAGAPPSSQRIRVSGYSTDSKQDRRGIVSAKVLKLFLLIFSDRILDSKVDRAMPSLVAAPEGPKTRPALSRKAVSIISFS